MKTIQVFKNKITSKFKAKFFTTPDARFVYSRLISDALTQKICKSKTNVEVEELTNPKYIEKGHKNKTKEILCLEVEKP